MNNKKNMLNQFTILFLLILFQFFYLSSEALSYDSPKIILSSIVEKEVKVNKGDKLISQRFPVEKAFPGDCLVYTITYKNEGENTANDVIINNPISKGFIYISGSAEDKDSEVTFSIDGGKTFHNQPKYIQKKPDGKLEEITAPVKMYSHIRWIIKKSLQPSQSGKVSFKVNVK